MKKILRVGNIKKYRTKCSVCDTEFEYQRTDVVFSTKLYCAVVECPSCGNMILHKDSIQSNITTEQL